MGSRSERGPVFYNGPIDEDHRQVMFAVAFAALACGFKLYFAEGEINSGKNRLKKILRLIRKCPLAIHDISMVKLDPKTGVSRQNMSFELGLFFGGKEYDPMQKNKKCLIFAHDPYLFRNSISDIAGHDVAAHGDSERIAIREVSRFLYQFNKKAPGDRSIWKQYQKFQLEFPAIAKELGIDPSFTDYVNIALRWLKFNAR